MQNGLVGIGVVGYGYWGPNLVRNFAAVEGAKVIAICDMDPKRTRESEWSCSSGAW